MTFKTNISEKIPDTDLMVSCNLYENEHQEEEEEEDNATFQAIVLVKRGGTSVCGGSHTWSDKGRAIEGAMSMAFGRLVRQNENPVDGIKLFATAFNNMIKKWSADDSA